MLKEVNALFLTHLHADHVVGIPDLWQAGWLIGRRDVPLQIWGPKGTADMISHLEKAFQFDIGIRLQYANTPPPRGVLTDTEEITQGVVYHSAGRKRSLPSTWITVRSSRPLVTALTTAIARWCSRATLDTRKT